MDPADKVGPDRATARSILFVNDNASVRGMFGKVLQNAGYRVALATGAIEALELLERESFSLVITDIHMPDLDGIRFTRILRSPAYADLNKIPILIVSGTFKEGLSKELLEDTGASEFISLPCRIEHFLKRVEALLDPSAAAEPRMEKRILIVDDEEHLLSVYCRVLQPLKYPIYTAHTAREALKIVETEHPFFVLTDYLLPDMNGIELLRRILASDPDTLVAMLTGHGSTEIAVDALKAGAVDYLTKPIDSKKLLDTISSLIRRGQTLQMTGYYKRKVSLLEDQIGHLSGLRRFHEILLDTLPAPIFATDDAGHVVYSNLAFQGLAGLSATQLLGRAMNDIFARPDWHKNLTTPAAHAAGPAVLEAGIQTPSGELRTFEITSTPVAAGNGYLGTPIPKIAVLMEDVTEVRRAVAQERAMQYQLQRTEVLAALAQMIAGAAHELNNPLAIILGYAEIGSNERLDGPQAQNAFEKIYSHALRCQKIILSLTAFARYRHGNKVYLDVHVPLSNALNLMSGLFEMSGIRLEYAPQQGLPLIPINEAESQEVFANILDNAYKALNEAKQPGVVRVETSQLSVPHPAVAVRIFNDGPWIAEENLRQLFRPFFTTRGVGKGPGLGLAACHGIMEQHGGRIEVENLRPAGVAFTLYFPISEPAS
ncbi:MAG: response regulator [Candidatus Wallbacteria bacterium]|nr:response regulator [Candidatus Wallbacteria bacterium]